MGRRKMVVLNAGDPVSAAFDQPLDIALTLTMADLKAQFMDPDSGNVDYRAIGLSEAFQRYKGLASRLTAFDLGSLDTRDQRLGFWINTYNTAVIHGVIELGLQISVKEVSGFFDRIVLRIGGYSFSLNQMEHGILRANTRPPYRLWRPFGRNDPRLQFVICPTDPRIHFALVCGARSCPPIGFYESDRIEHQLELAAASFINSSHVEVSPRDMSVSVSRIFKWYRSDFGRSREALLSIILRYMDEGDKKAFLEDNRDSVRIRYQAYDWSLNE